MAEYHYKYSPPGNSNGGGNNNADEIISWAVIVIALMAFWPVGLFLLFRKLMGSGSSTSSRSGQSRQSSSSARRYTYNYTYTAAAQPKPAAQPQPAAQPKPAAQAPVQGVKAVNVQPKRQTAPTPQAPLNRAQPVKKRAGTGFIIAGSILSGVFGFTFLTQVVDFAAELLQGNYWSYMLSDLAALGGFLGLGLVLLTVGISKKRKNRRFKKYLALIGKRETVNITTLAKASGRSYKKVCDDLQDMLDAGVLPMGYLDLGSDQLVISDQGIADIPREEKEEAPAAEAPKEDGDILAEIRAVNDQIPDPVMSAKIDRIQEITGKILDYQRKYPEKAGQLRSFLSYYLPTTLKILRAYAQLEQQGIEGENISAAKARIEGMMDKVVEGFEKQLDKLFQNTALDITSDVAVLEKMLDNDGLSQGGMTLGGV